MNREAIYAALFSKVEALAPATFTTASRRLAFVEELDPTAFPAVYQNQVSEAPAIFGNFGPIGIHLDLEWYVYAYAPDESSPSSPLLNVVMDAVLELLGKDQSTPVNFEVNGSQCAVWVNGVIGMWEGILGNRAVARIPIRVLVPNS